MVSLKVFLSLFLVAVAGAGNQQRAPYNFQWIVDASEYGNDYGHAEKSDGNSVHGQYYVLLPDGRTQIVTYTSDSVSGFLADVRYEGEAKFGGSGVPGFNGG